MAQSQRFPRSQISWKAFKLEAMLSRQWYLRRERLIVYSLTVLIGDATQGVAAYCSLKYGIQKYLIGRFTAHAAHVYNNDIFLTSTFHVIVILLFKCEYFILLFWPAQTYSARYLTVKKWISVLSTLGMFASVIFSTVIVAMRSASIIGVDVAIAQQLTELIFRSPLRYRSWTQTIIWLALLWIAVALNAASVALLLKALPKQKHTSADDSTPPNETVPISTSADDNKEKSMASVRVEEV